jgi:signal transduction histidine kinase
MPWRPFSALPLSALQHALAPVAAAWRAKLAWLRGALRPAGMLASLGIAAALAIASLALRAHILDAARRDLDVQAGLAAEAVQLRLTLRVNEGEGDEGFAGILPTVDLGAGGALALLGADGTPLARAPELPLGEIEVYGLPDNHADAGVIAVRGEEVLPPRLLAWRVLPEHGLTVVASREAAVVLLPWTRGMKAVAAGLIAVLAIAAAYGASAAAARARARASDAALSISEARAALVADALDVAIWFRDSPIAITRFFGDSVQRITGQDRRFLESRPGMWADAVQHPEDRAALRAARAEADAADARGEPPSDRQATFRIVRPDGEVRWILSRTRRLGNGASVGVLHDVTELTRAQAALARREAELAEVLRIARIGTLRIPPNQEVIAPSAELVSLWGLPEGTAALTMQRFAALLTKDTRASTLEALAAVRRGGGSIDLEFSIRRGDGALRHAWARARTEAGGEAEPAVVLVCQDITERRAAERALAHAQRMSALGHLTGGVAHDFNNLLTVVLLNLERIAEAAPPGSMAQSAAVPAIRAAETAARLTAQLLAFAGRQRLRPAAVDPARLLGELAPMLGRALGPGVSLSVAVAPGTPMVYADPTQLRTALLNLATNARDAMEGQGRVTITVAPEHLCDAGEENGGENGGENGSGNGGANGVAGCPGAGRCGVAFSVRDEGCGMTPETAARAFEPFFTTKPTGQASGLGLSQAYGFVAQSRGEIAIETAPGGGTTVRFVLPADNRAHPCAPAHVQGRRRAAMDETVA